MILITVQILKSELSCVMNKVVLLISWHWLSKQRSLLGCS